MAPTSNMRGRMVQALRLTWDCIADDVISLEGGRPVRRELVFEMVTDVGRLASHGGDNEAAVNFYQLPRDAQIKILKEAFPYRRYS